MPELPEIETIKLQLEKGLRGKIITGVEILKEKSFQGKKELIIGKIISGVKRWGKMLIIDLTGDIDIAIHLRMTGQLILEQERGRPACRTGRVGERERVVGGHPTKDFTGELPSKHTRVIIEFKSGRPACRTGRVEEQETYKLYFNDQRIFGFIRAGTKKEIENLDFLKNLGPEPFEIKETEWIKRLSGLKRPIKSAIMDQTIISGVGNIYANDALWEAGIFPGAISSQLPGEKLRDLFRVVKKVLREGIKYGGATATDDKYLDLRGMGGHYQEHFRVYDREGKKCLRKDGGIIEKFALGGRGTYYCPRCQK